MMQLLHTCPEFADPVLSVTGPCLACEMAKNSPVVTFSATGWICARCGASHAPFVSGCSCAPPTMTTVGSNWPVDPVVDPPSKVTFTSAPSQWAETCSQYREPRQPVTRYGKRPADDKGECLNCANPPHPGPCHRKRL